MHTCIRVGRFPSVRMVPISQQSLIDTPIRLNICPRLQLRIHPKMSCFGCPKSACVQEMNACMYCFMDSRLQKSCTSTSGVGRKCLMVGHVLANFVWRRKRPPELGLGGLGGMLPQENLNFRPSEIIFGAVNNAFVYSSSYERFELN